MTTLYKVEISAENMQQANDILDALLAKKLVTGGQIIQAQAHFLWKGSVNDMPEYCTITSFTTERHKSAIIDEAKRVTVEEVPMIWFSEIDTNKELADWIEATVV
jgi:uncharacterized protein involved in tolerance to divalent cations